MGDVEKEAFIETTLNTYRNKRLEKIIKEGEKRAEQVKGLTQSDNRLVLICAWFFAMVIFFFILPLFITGVVTKGMNKRTQKTYLVTIILIVGLHFLKIYIL